VMWRTDCVVTICPRFSAHLAMYFHHSRTGRMDFFGTSSPYSHVTAMVTHCNGSADSATLPLGVRLSH